MTLRDYVRILRERWKTVLLLVILSLGVAAGVTALTPRTYQATAQVFVASNGSAEPLAQYQAAAFAQQQVATYAKIIDAPQILNKVKQDLNLSVSDSDLKAKLSATAPSTQTIVEIQAIDSSASTAASLANSAAKAFVDVIEGYTKASNSAGSSVRLILTGPAAAPSAPISPNSVLNVAIGLLLGLLLGVAVAVAREVLDNRVREPEVLARVAGAPTMGVVVEDAKADRHPIATRAGSRNVRAENFRQLRANLQFANVDAHPRVIAITSSVPAEGKTMVAMNLASTLAEAGFTVCLVDADLRRPTVAKIMGLASPVGLTSVLIQQIDLSEALQNAGSNLYVLSSGPTPPNPSEVLASSYVREIIRSLLDKVDYVVIDTAPLLPVADGSEVAALADGTLLVARHKVTTDAQVKRATALLDRVDARLLGVVLNRVPIRRSGDYYGYTYYRAEPAEVGRPVRSEGRERRRRRTTVERAS